MERSRYNRSTSVFPSYPYAARNDIKVGYIKLYGGLKREKCNNAAEAIKIEIQK